MVWIFSTKHFYLEFNSYFMCFAFLEKHPVATGTLCVLRSHEIGTEIVTKYVCVCVRMREEDFQCCRVGALPRDGECWGLRLYPECWSPLMCPWISCLPGASGILTTSWKDPSCPNINFSYKMQLLVFVSPIHRNLLLCWDSQIDIFFAKAVLICPCYVTLITVFYNSSFGYCSN